MRLVFTFIACRMKILCVICHDLLTSSEDIFFTRCGHVFHHRCLLQWLERSSTCPQCRANVTQNRIHKAHFTVSNTETATDNAENLSSRDRIDSLKFQILLNERNIKHYTSKNATLEKQNAGLRQEVRKVESEMNQKNSAIYTLKEQINYFKERYEALRKKLSWEESMHKTLSTGTLEDVQAMVGQTTDCNTLLNCISDLKQVLLKKTRKIESLRAQLTEQENKSLERVAFHESENVFLQYRVSQPEKLLTSDQTVLLQPPCVTKSSSQRNSNENSLINVQTVDVCNQQINTKQQTADKNGPSSPEAEVEIIDNADTFDECPTVIKKAKLCLRSGGVNISTSPRWYRPFIAPGATAPANTQGSALIAQLTQPPSSIGLNVAAFSQRLDVAGNNVWAANQRLMMLLQQQNVQQATMSMANQPTHSQPGSQLTASCISQSVVPTQVPQTVTASQQAPVSVSSITQQITHSQAQGNVTTGTVQSQQLVPRERQNIWQGIVEWIENAKNSKDAQKQTRHVQCQVSVNAKDGDPELKADTWPPKLIMHLLPKQLIGSIGGTYLKNSKSVVFHPTPCEALESLTKMMTAGFAGCVHFTSAASSPACEIKVLILLYTADKKTYLGFIPNDQTAFVDRLRKVIQQQKTSQNASVRQANPGPGNTIPAPMPTTGTQGGILMSQTNTMAMGGGQITQNVMSTAPPQTLTSTSGPQTQMNMQNSGISGPQANAGAGGMIGQQRPQFDDLEIARHQNLLKIEHLRQTLEAIQQNLEVAQQQEMQYKQQLEAQQAQRGLNQAAMANQQAGAQRLMRPVSTNNLGLRHLLQQPQPQYSVRQVFGVQQQMVGPRGQIATRPMAPSNTQNQQFEDVSNYDFLG